MSRGRAREKDNAPFSAGRARREYTLANDTSATELVRDALDSDQKRKTGLAEATERVKERKARPRRRGVARRRRKRKRQRGCERKRKRERVASAREKGEGKERMREERERKRSLHCKLTTRSYPLAEGVHGEGGSDATSNGCE